MVAGIMAKAEDGMREQLRAAAELEAVRQRELRAGRRAAAEPRPVDGHVRAGEMSETEDRLYGLMEIAERQQAAVQAALDGLAAERAALGREREALARGVRDLQLGTQGAVRSAVTDSLAGAATEGVAAVAGGDEALAGPAGRGDGGSRGRRRRRCGRWCYGRAGGCSGG